MDFANLPEDILYTLLMTADIKEIILYCRLYYRFNNICSRTQFWQDKIFRDFKLITDSIPRYTWRELYKKLIFGSIKIVPVKYREELITSQYLLDGNISLEQTLIDIRKRILEYKLSLKHRNFNFAYEFKSENDIQIYNVKYAIINSYYYDNSGLDVHIKYFPWFLTLKEITIIESKDDKSNLEWLHIF